MGGTSVLIAQGKDRQRLFTAVQNDRYLASSATNEDIRWVFFFFFFKPLVELQLTKPEDVYLTARSAM